MRNPSEAFMKALNKHFSSMSVDEVDNDALQDFKAKYNQELDMRGPLTEKTAQTADDYLELAENATSKTKAIKYLKKACELDAENIDAELQLIDLTAKNNTEYLRRIEELLAKAKKQLEKEERNVQIFLLFQEIHLILSILLESCISSPIFPTMKKSSLEFKTLIVTVLICFKSP